MSFDFELLATGNRIAKTWSKKILGQRKFSQFLNVLFNPARAGEFGITEEQLAQIQEIPADDVKAIKSVKSMTDALTVMYKPLTFKIANRLAKSVGASAADRSQLQSEAMLGLIRAIRGYDRTDVTFKTYAYRTVSNEVSRYWHDNSSLGCRVNQNLVSKYNKKRRELETTGSVTFEEVAAAMGLSDKVRRRLSVAVHTSVCREADMEDALTKILLERRSDTRVDTELLERLGSAKLSAVELDSFLAKDDVAELFPQSMDSMRQVAEKYDLTPQAISVAAERARSKLENAIRKDWGDE